MPVTETIFIIIGFIILAYFMVVNLTYTLFGFISLVYIRRHAITGAHQNLESVLAGLFYRPLSIIVPAYNEERTLVTSVTSLLRLQYPEFEVIVVNDGSDDSTLAMLSEAFELEEMTRPVRVQLDHKPIRTIFFSSRYPNLVVIDKENGGKADALNAGINLSTYPLFCALDADSILGGDALLRATRVFVEDREVIATGGIVRVLNGCQLEGGMVSEIRAPKRAIESMQSVEYLRGFLSGRTAWNYFGNLLIISGAFGIFRKDMVLAIGGYRRTVGEDMDLVVRLHRHCYENKIKYKIRFIPDPVCYTQVPGDLFSLLKQRNRWQRGLVDSLIHNFVMFFNPRYGTVGLFAFPYFFFIETLGPIVEFTGYTAFVIFFFMGAVNREFAFLFFLVAILWGMWINIAAILLDNILFKRYRGVGDILKLCFYSLVEMLGYRQIISIERFVATFTLWNKRWGKVRREDINCE